MCEFDEYLSAVELLNFINFDISEILSDVAQNDFITKAEEQKDGFNALLLFWGECV